MSNQGRIKQIQEDLDMFEATTRDNIQFLLEANQRLVEALENIEKEASMYAFDPFIRMQSMEVFAVTALQAYKD